MKTNIDVIKIEHGKESFDIKNWNLEQAEMVNHYHRSFPEYQETPLADLKALANYFHVSKLLVKDESYRFGLNAFKVLGGSYALGHFISEKMGKSMEEMDYDYLVGEEVKEKLKELTFVTATDGNHGRGIAWTANRLKQKCVVYMPKGSAQERLDNIKKLGAYAEITDLSYDDAVRKAALDAETNGWILVQDTAWQGYEKIPTWIMQGYLSMAYETVKQMEKEQIDAPTHIFLQAGVGAMSGAITAFFSNYYKDSKVKPKIIIVEPEKANCIFKTAQCNDGKLHRIEEDMDTIMAGLACGEPCTIGWNIMHQYADYAASVSDSVAAKGMRILANPIEDDQRVISGESGAAGFGLVMEILTNPVWKEIKDVFGLQESSRILCFSTEGATNKSNYEKIVWDGLYSSL